VQKLEKKLASFRAAADEVRRRVQDEYRPLQARHNELRAQLVPLLDAACREPKALTKSERTKAQMLLRDAFHDLPERGHPEVQPILDRYAPSAEEQARLDRAEAESDREALHQMRQIIEAQLGIRFDPSVDISTHQKFETYVNQLLQEQYTQQQAAAEAAQARRAARPKSAKQLAAEARKAEEEKAVTQSVRTIYRDLVKALHP
jgi:hypothetical protein